MLDFAHDHFNFPVEMQPVFDKHGFEIPNSKCVMRTDTNEVLGVHGSRYQMLTHDDVVNSTLDALKTVNISRDYTTKVLIADGGRKMRGEIMFNDLTVQPEVGDYVKFRISFFNSYDASWAFSQSADGFRLWCLNGCTTPDVTAKSRFKHTQSISVDGSAAKMALGLDTFMQQPEKWKAWMKIGVTNEMAERFFKETLARTASRQVLNIKTNERQLDRLLDIWRDESRQLGSNKWALYNTMTYWASHTSAMKNPEVSRRNREDSIVSAMKNKAWKELA